MISLSPTIKSSIKTSLAMVIAYAVALHMNWERPYWAGFAVAMISLHTVGQSLNKAAMRMLGTFVAAAVALTIIAIFPQQRWMFMVILSLYIALCTYMYGGKKYQYFYYVSGFVCIVICFDGGVNSTNAFHTVLNRVLETGTGILAYELVNILIWPQSTTGEFNESISKLAGIQGQIFSAYLKQMKGGNSAKETQSLRMNESQLSNIFAQTLLAAKSDNYEVWECRRQWRYCQNIFSRLSETFERWRESLAETEKLKLDKFFPNLEIFCTELNMRFSQIEKILAGKQPEQTPQKISLSVNKAEIATMSHFEKATLSVTKTHLDDIEMLTQSLFKCIQNIKDPNFQFSESDYTPLKHTKITLDNDRLLASIRVMITMWIAYLIWIAIRIPGDTGFPMMTAILAIALSITPFMSPSMLIKPAIYGSAIGSLLYIFIMPHLSGFFELGVMMFVAVFIICYIFRNPKQTIYRTLGLVLLVVLTSVTNNQTYNFLSVADTVLMFALSITLLIFTAHIPTTAYPEKAFMSLLRRFFRNAEYQLSRLSIDAKKEQLFSRYWKKVFYSEDLLELTYKLQKWGNAIDHKLFPDNTVEKIQDLLVGLQDLAVKINLVTDAGVLDQADSLRKELSVDFTEWRIAIQRLFRELQTDSEIKSDTTLQNRLTKKLALMEKHIKETLNSTDEREINIHEYENFYNLLSGFQGLSQSVIAHEKSAANINWQQWQEARF